MLTLRKKIFRFVLFVSILVYVPSLDAQEGTGGTTSLFTDGGVGARALALGGANVAVAVDPTVVFWNSAGLDFIQKFGVTFYRTNLIAGGGYNFIGVAYPTLSIGGFGFGWIGLGTDGIEPRDASGILEGPADNFSQNQFFFGYAKQVRGGVSLGLSLKIETLSSLGGLNDSGVGLDLGVLYRPAFESAALRDLAIGINVQNVLQPKMKLVDRSDASPRNFKFGLAKPFRFGNEERMSAFTLVFDFNKSENAPSRLNFGVEYSFDDKAMLRVGANDGQVTFGAGASYRNVRLDYSFGKLFAADEFSGSHRFSITIEIGKSKTERIELARLQRERELQISINNQLWFESETQFNTNMEEGLEKYYNEDYQGAYVDFYSAAQAAENLVEIALRFRGDNNSDPEANIRVETANEAVLRAQEMLKLANTKYDSVQDATMREIVAQTTRSAREKELRDFVLKKRQRGDAFFKRGLFSQAIAQWSEALDALNGYEAPLPTWAPEVKSRLESSIQSAQKQLEGNVEEALRRADRLIRRKDYVGAINVLDRVIATGGVSQSELKRLNTKKQFAQSLLSFQQNFEAGVRLYESKDWKGAMAAFERALRDRPNDPRARKYYEDARARSLARPQEMPANLRVKYVRGRELYRRGMYKEALEIWEEILKEQPYNKTILDAIDRARERLRERR